MVHKWKKCSEDVYVWVSTLVLWGVTFVFFSNFFKNFFFLKTIIYGCPESQREGPDWWVPISTTLTKVKKKVDKKKNLRFLSILEFGNRLFNIFSDFLKITEIFKLFCSMSGSELVPFNPKTTSINQLQKNCIREKNDFEISEIIRKSRNGKTSRELTERFAW